MWSANERRIQSLCARHRVARLSCPPGKTKVWILYDDDNKFRAREADKKGEHKEEYFAGYVVEGRGGEKDKEFPFTSRLFRLDQTGKKRDILYYQGRRCVEADE